MSLNRLDPKADLNDPRVRAQLNETLNLMAAMILRLGKDGKDGLKGEKGDPGQPGSSGAAGSGANAFFTGGMTVTTGAFTGYIPWTVVADDVGMTLENSDTNLLFPSAGDYLIVAGAEFVLNTTGVRDMAIVHYDSADTELLVRRMNQNAIGGGVLGTGLNVGAILRVSAGDYIRMFTYQSSGGNLVVGTKLEIRKL